MKKIEILNKIPENDNSVKRKVYLKPAIEIVPLYPKQTVLGGGCFSTSQNVGELEVGCGVGLCLLT